MKKVSTAATKQSKNFSQRKLTIGLDLGDRSSWGPRPANRSALPSEVRWHSAQIGLTPRRVGLGAA
jgi:hypothetical protein